MPRWKKKKKKKKKKEIRGYTIRLCNVEKENKKKIIKYFIEHGAYEK